MMSPWNSRMWTRFFLPFVIDPHFTISNQLPSIGASHLKRQKPKRTLRNLLKCSPFGVKEGREETVCASPHHPLPHVADTPSQWLWPFAPDLRTNISFMRSSESECTWMIVCMCICCIICTICHITVACEMLLFLVCQPRSWHLAESTMKWCIWQPSCYQIQRL